MPVRVNRNDRVGVGAGGQCDQGLESDGTCDNNPTRRGCVQSGTSTHAVDRAVERSQRLYADLTRGRVNNEVIAKNNLPTGVRVQTEVQH